AHVAVLQRRYGTTGPGHNRGFHFASGGNGNFCFWRTARRRGAAGNGFSWTTLPRHRSVLEGVDLAIELQGPLAGNGAPLGPGLKTTHQPQTWFPDCCTDVFSTREYWGGPKLGLSLPLAARCDVYALCPYSIGVHRRNRSIHRMAERKAG